MIYVIVLNWNSADDTISCLESLKLLNGRLPKIVVCDNGSRDNSWERLKNYVLSQDFLEIELIHNEDNLGYAGGNNVGLRIALADPKMEYVWILNNDTKVDPCSLEALLTYMLKHSDVGICGSTLLYMDNPGLIQAVGGQYNSWLGTSSHILGHQIYSEDLCNDINASQIDYVVGASLFIRRTVLDCVGLMNEDYFLYCEEIDWAIRMKRLMPRLKLGYAAKSLVYHKEGGSTGANDLYFKTYSYFSDFFFIVSRMKFARKFYPLRSFFVQMTMVLVAINRLRRRQWLSAAVAFFAFIGYVPKMLDPRK